MATPPTEPPWSLSTMSPAGLPSPPRRSRASGTARTGSARPPGSACSRPSRSSATCPTAPPRACPAAARTSSAWCASSAGRQASMTSSPSACSTTTRYSAACRHGSATASGCCSAASCRQTEPASRNCPALTPCRARWTGSSSAKDSPPPGTSSAPPNSPDAIQRRLALDHALRGNPRCQLIGSAQGIFSIASGEQAAEELLVRHRAALPDAVVCANDQMAIGVLRALTAAGIRVPGEVAVTGFDDIHPARLADPPLTTVRQPMRTLGERACARLLDRIAYPSLSPVVQLLPTELVLRSSCGCPPGTEIRQTVRTLKPG